MKITYFGTTTLLFDDGKDQVLFDCHLTRPSLARYLFGRAGTDRALADRVQKDYSIDRLRAVFISHTHHDHVMDAPYAALRTGARIFGSSSALNAARGGGVPEGALVLFRGGETFRIGGFSVRIIPSLHSKPTVFNNDLGETIDRPLVQPARLRVYKEGGSFDFLVEAEGKRYVIRPSFSQIPGQYKGCRADVLFLGTAGLGKAGKEEERTFYKETLDRIRPSLVIPLHWDNFFLPLTRPARLLPWPMDRTDRAFFRLAGACRRRGISCLVQIPGTFIEL